MPPQDVVLADEPVVVDREQFDALSQGEDSGAADERDVVEMDDVEAPGEDRFDRRMLDDRPSRLVGEKRRGQRPAALKLMDRHAVGLFERRGRGRRVQGARDDPPRVGVVDHFDFASAPGQRMDEVADVISVAAEIAGRIEGRHDRDAERVLVPGAVIIHSAAPGVPSSPSINGEFHPAGK